MTSHISATLVLLFAAALWCASARVTAGDGGNLELTLVQVVHRHGARTPVAELNRSILCGSLGCGMLTDTGKEMLVQLGQYMRATYGQPLRLPDHYDPRVTVQRSTELPRTLQSASAFLRGLYSNGSDWYPAINTKPLYDDSLLVINAHPSFTMYYSTNTDVYEYVAKQAQSLFTAEELTEVGMLLSSDAYCATNLTTPLYFGYCALYLADIIISLGANGQLAAMCPICGAKMEQWHAVQRFAGEFFYQPDPQSDFKQQAGTWGQHLLRHLLENAAGADAVGSNEEPQPRLFEFSGHDTTLIPLASTLGLLAPEFYEPRFGQALIAEAFIDRSTNTTVVGFKYGLPNQTFGSSHSYTFVDVHLTCVAPDGAMYGDTRCPVDDIGRFALRSLPASPMGECYREPDAMALINCTTLSAPWPTKILEGGICYWYRTKCAQFGCPEGYYVSPVDKSCLKM